MVIMVVIGRLSLSKRKHGSHRNTFLPHGMEISSSVFHPPLKVQAGITVMVDHGTRGREWRPFVGRLSEWMRRMRKVRRPWQPEKDEGQGEGVAKGIMAVLGLK